MAKIGKLPDQQIIDGFKGVVDFYLYMGIPCARKWPVWKPREPTLLEKANQEKFAYINKAYKTLPVEIIEAFEREASATPFTAKDLVVRAYMKGLGLELSSP